MTNQTHQALSAGTIIDSGKVKYTIIKKLGQGGFGITYLVDATTRLADGTTRTDRLALKEHFISDYCSRDNQTLMVEYSQPVSKLVEGSLRAFMSEARRVKSLGIDHPNIVKINEVFKANNTAYYSMEYLGDTSLEKLVARQPLDEATTMRLMKPVIEAISTLHQNKVAHYDLKPANIMLTNNNTRAVVIDFGLAKHYDSKGNATSTIAAAGLSRGYAPIEQYAGIKQFSPGCDVYALGAILYFMLTGQQPPEPIDFKDIDLPSKLKGVSPKIKQVVTKALEFDKNQRYQNAGEMLDDINGKGPATVVLPQKQDKRRSNWIGIGVAAVIILSIYLFFSNRHSSPDDAPVITDTMAVAETTGDEAVAVAEPEPVINERTTSQDMDLCVSRDGHNYFFSEEEWYQLNSDEQARYTKKGLVVKRGGQSFIVSLNYYPKMTWHEANRRFGNKLPRAKWDEVLVNNYSDINTAIKAYGGDVPLQENWIWSGDHNSHEYEGKIYEEVYVIDMTGDVGIEPESPEAKYYVRTTEHVPRGG